MKQIPMTQSEMMSKYYYINTIGCQMNVYDSARLADMLNGMNYTGVDSYRKADLIIVNTCTIRDKARQKAVSFLGRLAALKRKNPALVIAVGGCVAQNEGQSLIDKFPHVDIVFGTHVVTRLPELVDNVLSGGGPIVDTSLTEIIDAASGGVWHDRRSENISEFVTIMRGCDNYCTYCVVPYVRGRETSRRPEYILDEVRDLAASGVKEIVLLGQNVNSYGNREGLCSFPELLAMVNEIDGIERIRFTTSHPKDLSDDLIDAFKILNKLCDHFHLPVQSGSNRILKRMNRKYSRSQYLERVAKLRETVPDISLTTDIIVGFPGETEADFDDTASLLGEVLFDGIFGFMYSDRSLAPAAQFPDKIPEKEKNRRLNRLLDLQKDISEKKNRALVGRTVTVLVEGPSKRTAAGESIGTSEMVQWTGRTTTNKVVNFMLPERYPSGEGIKPGDLIRVSIEGGFAHSLSGRATLNKNDAKDTGGNFHAA